MEKKFKQLFVVILLILFAAGCNNEKPSPSVTPSPSAVETETAPPATTNNPDESYPTSPTAMAHSAGYDTGPQPTIEGLSPDLPDPEIIFPEGDPTTGVIGGVLAREITGEGYVPLQPRQLILGRIIRNDSGEQVLISVAESAQRAELFATGVFLFNQVPPGEYAVVIDLGFTEFPLLDENDEQILLTIEGGTTIDLGQILVKLPEG